MVAEEFFDIGRAKLVKAGEQQIAIAELEGRDGQHGLRLVGQASGAQHPRCICPRVPYEADYRPICSARTGQCAGNAPRCVRVCAHQSLSPRRSFTTEYKVEAAHRVIDSGRTIAEVARELGVNEGLLGGGSLMSAAGWRPRPPVTTCR